MVLVLLISVVIIIFIGFLLLEKKEFNNGICEKCNTALRLYRTDSDKCRHYTCDSCGYSCMISFDSVDKEFRQK